MMRNHPQSTLPPGFRFHPTDEELILHYLKKRINSSPLPVSIIAEVDIYKFDPWDLPAIAAFGEKEWYFFTPRDRKYPNGARPNRAAASGYWKATGTDKTITTATGGGGEQNVGVKKALVFYKGKPPKGTKTNWIMHEYRLAEALLTHHQNNHANKLKDSPMRLDDWVLCRIYKKSHASTPASASDQEQEEDEKFFQETLNLPSLVKSPSHNMTSLLPPKTSSFSNLLDAMDYSLLSSFLSDTTHLNPSGFESPHLLGALGNIEQPFFSNYNNRNNNNDYLIERLPDLSSASPTMENRVKRQNKSINNEHDMSNVSKKMKYSDSFTNNNQSDLHMIQNNMAKQSFLNQHLLLSPFNLQFQL